MVATDALVSRELKSLQEELSASHRERPSPPADSVSVNGGTATAMQASQLQGAAEEQQLRGTLDKFVEAITEFVEGAEKNVSAHPAANVMGGIVVGILIGRLLGRR
jgi:ElaB/YqjD/DUF883 family membrane-anchored ribosome-binding protein